MHYGFYYTFKGLLVIYEKNKIVPFALVAIYVIAIIVNLLFFETDISHGRVDTKEKIFQIADIYGANKTILQKEKDLNLDELEILKTSLKIISNDSKVEVAGDIEQGFWAYAITRRINNDDKHTGVEKLEYKMMSVGERAGKVDYVIYFNRGEYYQIYKEALWQNAKLVYENEAGGILKYNTKVNE